MIKQLYKTASLLPIAADNFNKILALVPTAAYASILNMTLLSKTANRIEGALFPIGALQHETAGVLSIPKPLHHLLGVQVV